MYVPISSYYFSATLASVLAVKGAMTETDLPILKEKLPFGYYLNLTWPHWVSLPANVTVAQGLLYCENVQS
jgi:hypothetical protein